LQDFLKAIAVLFFLAVVFSLSSWELAVTNVLLAMVLVAVIDPSNRKTGA
jgi:hypothetical protein